MDMFRSILALSLLAVLAWIAGYAVCHALLSRSQWSPRLHIEHRFPADRFKKINRVISVIVGLIVAAITMYYCAPTTISTLAPFSHRTSSRGAGDALRYGAFEE